MKQGKWYTFRTTTDKLTEHLNHIEESGDTVVGTAQFQGGRDWMIFARKGQQRPDALDEFAREAEEQFMRGGR